MQTSRSQITLPFNRYEHPAPETSDHRPNLPWAEKAVVLFDLTGGILDVVRYSTIQTDPQTGFTCGSSVTGSDMLYNPGAIGSMELRFVIAIPTVYRKGDITKAFLRWYLVPRGVKEAEVVKEDNKMVFVKFDQPTALDCSLLAENVLYDNTPEIAKAKFSRRQAENGGSRNRKRKRKQSRTGETRTGKDPNKEQ